MDFFDNLLGGLDILQRIQSWATFAVAPVSRRAKHGQLDLVTLEIPRPDKTGGPQAGTEILAYLKRFGVIAAFSGFDSRNLYFQVRCNQQKWADHLLNVDADGIPQLDYSRKNWKESAAELKRQKRAEKREQRRAASWLDKLFG